MKKNKYIYGTITATTAITLATVGASTVSADTQYGIVLNRVTGEWQTVNRTTGEIVKSEPNGTYSTYDEANAGLSSWLETQASTVETPVTETTVAEAPQTSADIKPAIDAQQAVVDATAQDATNAQADADAANQDVTTAQAEVDTATQAVKDAEANTVNATPENIAANQADQAANLADQTANATETDEVNAEIASQTQTVADAQVAVDTAQAEKDQADSAVTAAETDVKSAQDALSGTGLAEAQATLDQATKDVTTAQDNVTTATTAVDTAKKADADRRTAIDAATTDLAVKTDAVDTAKAKLTTATEAKSITETNLLKAEEDLQKASKNFDNFREQTILLEAKKVAEEAKSAYQDVKTKVEDTQGELDKQKEYQNSLVSAVNRATENLNQAIEEESKLQEKLATAQEELSKQRSLLEEATSDLSEKTLALSKTEEAYKEKQNELEQLKENLVGKDLTGIYRVELSPSLTRWSLRPGRPEIVITSEDSEEFKQLTSEQQSLYRQRKQETDALYKKAAIIFGDKRMGQVDGSIQVAPESDKDRLVDIHNMSFEDYVEINELGARILNDLRYQTSQNAGESDTFAPSIITTGSIEISKNIVEAYSNLPKHPRGHVLSILDKFGGPSIVENYYSAGRYSVQGQGEKKSIYSMYHLKQALITSITNSTLNDAHYYDGHAKLNMDYKSGTVGFGFSITVGGVLQVHTFSRIAIGPYGTKEENDSDKYNYTNERYLNSLIPRAQANQEKIDDLREVLEKAKSELLELQNKLANSQQIVQEKQLTVELASQKVEELATRTDTVAMARQELESHKRFKI
ncbi:TPA: SEC10/PgrA surface exclusion domain-containing protein [Streptococcus suis]|nr:SEC10/PgrA surface exclusion domain-containing protein [Streptococcus suis]